MLILGMGRIYILKIRLDIFVKRVDDSQLIHRPVLQYIRRSQDQCGGSSDSLTHILSLFAGILILFGTSGHMVDKVNVLNFQF